MKGTIIFLNGPSSAGKTTLAYALQEELYDVYYRIAADDFMKMVDRQKMHDDFFVRLGEALSAMHYTIKLFSDRGLHVIVDHVLMETPEEAFTTPECVRLFQDNPVLFVRVDYDLPELERRERARGDRQIGQAKWQLAHMHSHNTYDLTLNTFRQDTKQCTGEIIKLLSRPELWTAFRKLHKYISTND